MSRTDRSGFHREERRTTRAYLDEARHTANNNSEGLRPDLSSRTERKCDDLHSQDRTRRRKKRRDDEG